MIGWIAGPAVTGSIHPARQTKFGASVGIRFHVLAVDPNSGRAQKPLGTRLRVGVHATERHCGSEALIDQQRLQSWQVVQVIRTALEVQQFHGHLRPACLGRDASSVVAVTDRASPAGHDRAVKAIWNGAVIADSDDGVVVEGNYYFPADSVNKKFLAPSDTHSTCPWKGLASYYDVVVDGQRNSDAAWYYAEPKPAAAGIKGHIAFWKGVRVVKADLQESAPAGARVRELVSKLFGR